MSLVLTTSKRPNTWRGPSGRVYTSKTIAGEVSSAGPLGLTVGAARKRLNAAQDGRLQERDLLLPNCYESRATRGKGAPLGIDELTPEQRATCDEFDRLYYSCQAAHDKYYDEGV